MLRILTRGRRPAPARPCRRSTTARGWSGGSPSGRTSMNESLSRRASESIEEASTSGRFLHQSSPRGFMETILHPPEAAFLLPGELDRVACPRLRFQPNLADRFAGAFADA